MKSPVERLNEIKEKELELIQKRIKNGEIINHPDLKAEIERKTSYSENPVNKLRKNKGPIGIDRD